MKESIYEFPFALFTYKVCASIWKVPYAFLKRITGIFIQDGAVIRFNEIINYFMTMWFT